MVLMALADRYNQTSGRCDPGVTTIATDAMVSVRTVQMALLHLSSLGLIEVIKRENLTSQYHLKFDVRITETETSEEGAEDAPDGAQTLHRGGATVAGGVVQEIREGGAGDAPKPRNLTKEEEPRENPPIVPQFLTRKQPAVRESTFEEFWTAYPRKVGKDAARKAFELAARRAPVREIMAGLARATFSPDPQYQPHPSTWLNQGRWKDNETASPGDLFALTTSPRFTVNSKRGAMSLMEEKARKRQEFQARGEPIPDEYLTLEEAIERDRQTLDHEE
jgi:hypothetical protein